MTVKKYRSFCTISALFLLLTALPFTGCGDAQTDATGADNVISADASTTYRDNTPVVHTPTAGDTALIERNQVSLDCSNTKDGYVTLIYSGNNEKTKFQITTPDEVTYTYLVTKYGEPIVFPLTGGDGEYAFSVLESVDISSDLYAVSFTEPYTVTLTDEFMPFLVPTVYSNFTLDSVCVSKGQELAQQCGSDLDVIENIYNYVTASITYDEAKAQSVSYGYIPNPDETLSSQTGICFDYASLMTAMLRSQRIPTKLEVGYAGEAYHAWISCYVPETGWVDNIIQFDGEHWSLMDPTLAANNNRKDTQNFIGDGSKYIVKYTY